MKKLVCLVLALGITTSGLATANAAQKSKKKPEDVFKEMDSNQDKKLSLEEYVAGKKGRLKTAAEKIFKTKDKNKDNNLSLEEFKGAKTKAPIKKKKRSKSRLSSSTSESIQG